MISIIDYVTLDYFVFEFYLFPVIIAVWFSGRNTGIFVALIAVSAEIFIDIITTPYHSSPWVHYWNFFLNLGFFVAVVYLLTYLKKILLDLKKVSDTDRIINEQLQIEIEYHKQEEEVLTLQTQELVRSNTELERFTHVVSHDLQEPLRMVSKYVQLIEKRYQGKFDKDADEFIAFAVEGVSWMQSLINALLAYARVGTRSKSFESTDCNQVIARVLMNLQVAIEESNAVVTSDELPVMTADSLQMIQLFQNLISNAIKFKGQQQPRVHVAAKKQEHEWLFSVSDNGIGIDLQNFTGIFEMFQRLHSRREYPGTGIGLAVCKKIVEQHGGRIWVESAPQKGSAFYFTIPQKN